MFFSWTVIRWLLHSGGGKKIFVYAKDMKTKMWFTKKCFDLPNLHDFKF